MSRTFKQRYGPWAVVTGASSGIGLAIAEEAARRGVNTVLVGRRLDALETLGARLRSDFGVQARAVSLDLSEPDADLALFAATQELDAGLLVAAAGFGTSGPFLRADVVTEGAMVEVNCVSVMRQCRHYGERFARRGRGGIILMGSLLGFQGVPRSANYAATKAYVQSLAEGLRTELAADGVDVLSSAPGPVRSGFEARAGMHMQFAASPASVARATLDALGRKTTVVPGALSKVLTYSLAVMPRAIRTRILTGIMAGMTKHQV